MRLFLLLFLSVAFFACGTNRNVYQSPDFGLKSATHRQIAILPFRIVQTGHVGKNETAESIAASNEKWSYNFQETLLSYSLKYTSRNRKGQLIAFQSVQKTNALLKEAGLSIDDLYNKQPEDIARILKVDAVLMTTLERDKNFSDGLAYGLATGKAIVNVLSKRPGIVGTPNASDINLNSYLYDAADSKLLWKTFRQGGTDLPSSVDGLVEFFSNWIAKKLPYRS